MPLTKLDTNIVSAINKSSKEYRISKVIFGLSDKHIFKDKIFGSLSENYIKNSKEMVFLTRISHSLNASRNILLIIPPLINRQRGFEDSFNTVVKLANSLSDGITVILEERTKEEMESLLFAVKNVEIKFKVIVSWKNIEESISEIITESDLIIQINARSWELAWRLEFDKMAVKIANRFNKNNMITLFPYSYSEEDGDIIKKAVIESKFIEKLSKENFYFDLNVKNWEEYIEFIIKENFKIGSIFIIKQLKEVLYNNPIELSEEIELVHKYFSPTEEEYKNAVEMLNLFEESQKENKGVAIKDGKFLGPPLVIAAKKIIHRANLIQNRQTDFSREQANEN